MDTKFVDVGILRSLLRGSYESRMARAYAAVQESGDYWSADKSWVLGTFPEYAIVVTDSGRFMRVGLNEDFEILSVEDVDVPLLEGSEAAKLEALHAMSLLREGKTEEALSLVEHIATFAPAFTQDAWADRLVAKAQEKRPWRVLYDAHSELFGEVIGDADDCEIEPVFEAIFDEEDSSDLEQGHFVRTELDKLFQSLDDLATTVKTSVERLPVGAHPSLREAGIDDRLLGFGRDLAEDLERLGCLVREASFLPFRSGGRVYDAIAKEYPIYQAACSFIEKLSGETAPA